MADNSKGKADQRPKSRNVFSRQLLHRERDKKWHFVGQQDGEVVRLVVREHKIFLLPPALPFIGSVVLLFITLGTATVLRSLGLLWLLVNIAVIMLVIGTGIWLVERDFIEWWYQSYIITDKRIISLHGLLELIRQQASMEKVTQVGIDMPSPLNFLLNYGTIHVYYAGGELVMEHMPDPERVKEAIQGITEEIKSKKKEEEKPPTPQDPEMGALLEKLGQEKEVPKLPDADEKYPPLRNQDRYRGPRRRFGGPLRIPCNVRYVSGEYTVMYLQRSCYVLYRNLALPVILLLIILPAGFSTPALLPIISIFALVLLIIIALIWTNYVDDVFILTNKRIIDIERRLIIFYEAHTQTEYRNVRDTKVKFPNVIQRLLDVGDVYIETPGFMPDIVFSNVNHPFLIRDKVNEIKEYQEKARKIRDENVRKKPLDKWFSSVLSNFEDIS